MKTFLSLVLAILTTITVSPSLFWATGFGQVLAAEGSSESHANKAEHSEGASEGHAKKAAEKSSEKNSEKASEKSAEKQPEKSEGKNGEKSAEKTTEKAGDKEGEKLVKKSPVPSYAIRRPVHADFSAQKGCLVDQSAFEDIRHIREDLDAKKKELATKESDLKSREAAINEEFKKLTKARDDLAAAQDLKKKVDEEKLNKLVETLLIMSPKAASKLLSTVDDELAVAAIYKMDTTKLGKILNVMDTPVSSKLTELMVGLVKRTRGTASSMSTVSQGEGPKSVSNPEKGGETKNDRTNDSITNTAARSQSNGTAQQPQKPVGATNPTPSGPDAAR